MGTRGRTWRMVTHLRVGISRVFPFRETDQPTPSSRSSNRMPAAVKDAIRFAVEKYGGHKPDAAIEFVNAMERDGRLIEECWS
jgi:hypothetical protein